MGMKQTLDVINRMETDGIIGRYAIAGAVAAYNYIEPTVTEDLDILVSFDQASSDSQSGLITLSPILSYLKAKGYEEFRKEGLLIEDWSVQFLPVANELDAEALARAEQVDVRIAHDTAVTTRVLRPEHLVATSLRVGRPKDLIRITQFIEENAIDISALCAVLDRHKLREMWRAFCARTGIADPCALHGSA
jgi:hypothetical protein